MKAFEKSVVEAESGFDINVSPVNTKDGLITDGMKSAIAAKKGGTSPVADVLYYEVYITKLILIYYSHLEMMWKAHSVMFGSEAIIA